MTNDERRPAGNGTASKVSVGDHTSVPSKSLARRDILELADRRAYAVRVVSIRRDGVLVSQLYADLRAAERKADRTRARGLDARLELVHVIPVQPLDDEGAE